MSKAKPEKVPEELDQIVDKVLAYDPSKKKEDKSKTSKCRSRKKNKSKKSG